MKANTKQTLLALGLAILCATTPAHAQIDLLHQSSQPDTNPMLNTTGPGTLGARHMLLEFQLGWRHSIDNIAVYAADCSYTNGIIISHLLEADEMLRYGIGKRFELALGIEAESIHDRFRLKNLEDKQTYRSFAPKMGAKYCFFEGKGWIPQMALRVELWQPIQIIDNRKRYSAGSTMHYEGLELRNRLGQHWVLDYSLGFSSFPPPLGIVKRSRGIQYSLFARWLPTRRMMVSIGMEDGWGRAEMNWQATDALQMQLRAGLAGGSHSNLGMMETYTSVGLKWMIR